MKSSWRLRKKMWRLRLLGRFEDKEVEYLNFSSQRETQIKAIEMLRFFIEDVSVCPDGYKSRSKIQENDSNFTGE